MLGIEKSQIMVTQVLDVTGLNCPLPILKAKVALNKMQAGEILHVKATDPHAVVDFKAYCARTDHELVKITTSEILSEFYIQRGNA